MNFKEFSHSIKVGVVGFSDDSKIESEEQVKAYFRQGIIDLKIPSNDLTIVSGLTNVGVPKLCYEEAKRLKYKTVGITAEEAKNYDLFPCDESYFIGDKFGEESPFFLQYINFLIKIGGGKQSIKEFKDFKGPKVEYDLEKGTYAGLNLTDESNQKIIDLCKQLELKDHINKKDIHITLLYSRKVLSGYSPKKTKEEVILDKFKIFKDNNGKNVLVVTLKDGYCQKRHNQLMKLHDATYDYPEYIPHITLSYDYRDDKLPKFIDIGKLQLETEYIEDLNLDKSYD
jgi:2'-5' RNA ligase